MLAEKEKHKKKNHCRQQARKLKVCEHSPADKGEPGVLALHNWSHCLSRGTYKFMEIRMQMLKICILGFPGNSLAALFSFSLQLFKIPL